MPVTAPSLLTALRRAVQTLHYSPRTGDAYAYWVRRFVRLSGLRHPRELGPSDASRFRRADAARGLHSRAAPLLFLLLALVHAAT